MPDLDETVESSSGDFGLAVFVNSRNHSTATLLETPSREHPYHVYQWKRRHNLFWCVGCTNFRQKKNTTSVISLRVTDGRVVDNPDLPRGLKHLCKPRPLIDAIEERTRHCLYDKCYKRWKEGEQDVEVLAEHLIKDLTEVDVQLPVKQKEELMKRIEENLVRRLQVMIRGREVVEEKNEAAGKKKRKMEGSDYEIETKEDFGQAVFVSSRASSAKTLVETRTRANPDAVYEWSRVLGKQDRFVCLECKKLDKDAELPEIIVKNGRITSDPECPQGVAHICEPIPFIDAVDGRVRIEINDKAYQRWKEGMRASDALLVAALEDLNNIPEQLKPEELEELRRRIQVNFRRNIGIGALKDGNTTVCSMFSNGEHSVFSNSAWDPTIGVESSDSSSDESEEETMQDRAIEEDEEEELQEAAQLEQDLFTTESKTKPGCFYRWRSLSEIFGFKAYICKGCHDLNPTLTEDKIATIRVVDGKLQDDPDEPANAQHFCEPMNVAESGVAQMQQVLRNECRQMIKSLNLKQLMQELKSTALMDEQFELLWDMNKKMAKPILADLARECLSKAWIERRTLILGTLLDS